MLVSERGRTPRLLHTLPPPGATHKNKHTLTSRITSLSRQGLNVFNTALTLADPKSATDSDYERIESVVGHEYFHNWTGNRVTCRDWFQVSPSGGKIDTSYPASYSLLVTLDLLALLPGGCQSNRSSRSRRA